MIADASVVLLVITVVGLVAAWTGMTLVGFLTVVTAIVAVYWLINILKS